MQLLFERKLALHSSVGRQGIILSIPDIRQGYQETFQANSLPTRCWCFAESTIINNPNFDTCQVFLWETLKIGRIGEFLCKRFGYYDGLHAKRSMLPPPFRPRLRPRLKSAASALKPIRLRYSATSGGPKRVKTLFGLAISI